MILLNPACSRFVVRDKEILTGNLSYKKYFANTSIPFIGDAFNLLNCKLSLKIIHPVLNSLYLIFNVLYKYICIRVSLAFKDTKLSILLILISESFSYDERFCRFVIEIFTFRFFFLFGIRNILIV